jgi:hypothetical protein
LEPASPKAPEGKPVARRPLLAVVMSFIAPGLGHLYVGQSGTAFLLGFIGIIASPLWVLLWSEMRFSGPVFLWVGWLLPRLLRFGAALAAGMRAHKQPPMPPMRWQQPLGYATFFMLFFMLTRTANDYVSDHFAADLAAPTDAQAPAIRQGDGMWMVRTRASHVPRKGAVVVFKRYLDTEGIFRHQAAPALGTVVAMGGDEVEVTADAVILNGEALPNSGGGKPAEKVTLREGQVFLLSPNRSATAPDCRDYGPLAIRDYVGEVALVQSNIDNPFAGMSSAKSTVMP